MRPPHTRLVLTEAQYAELVDALGDERETAAVMSVRVIEDDDGLTLLARVLTWAPPSTYADRTRDGLRLTSSGWVPEFRAAARRDEAVVFIHTHPGGTSAFSGHDDAVDAELAAAATALGAARPYCALVVAGTTHAPEFHARVYRGAIPVSVEAIRVVGDRIRILPRPMAVTADAYDVQAADVFDRQARLFGADGQRILGTVRAAIVGTGGTGSAVAEQLARLGVGHITLVDDDAVTAPTPTRGYGIRARDVGRPKASVLAEDLRAVGLGSTFDAVVAPLHDGAALRALHHADVVFSCVDGHGARLILNRWAWAHLAPVIDVAVLVTAGSNLTIDGRVTWLAPGSACLLCRGRVDSALAYAENLDPDTRRALAGEGYVAAAATAQPAVVTLTTLVSSVATTELLLRLFGFGETTASELLLHPVRREVRRNSVPPRSGCFCTDPEFRGRGVQEPYLNLTWPA